MSNPHRESLAVRAVPTARALLVLLALALALPSGVRAADGEIDPTFYDNGHLVLDTGMAGAFTVAQGGMAPDHDHYWWATDWTLGTSQTSPHYLSYVSLRIDLPVYFKCTFTVPGAVPYTVRLSDAAVDAQGRLVLAGTALIDLGGNVTVPAVVLTRVVSPFGGCTGISDPTFDSGGHPGWSIYSFPDAVDSPRIAIDALGGIDLVGTLHQSSTDTDILVTRLLAGGTIDPNFAPGQGYVHVDWMGSFDSGRGIAVSESPAGTVHLWVVGDVAWTGQRTDYDSYVARLSANGSIEASLVADLSLAHRDDRLAGVAWDRFRSKLYAVGYTASAGSGHAIVARLTAAGALDATFSGDGTVDFPFPAAEQNGDVSSAFSVAVQGDGKPVVGGVFYASSGGAGYDFAAARLTQSGALDGAFHANGRTIVGLDLGDTDWDISYALSLGDGRPLLLGMSTIADGTTKVSAARLTNSEVFRDGFESGTMEYWAVTP
jgi:uncharacterized delta-60 repeat protein